MHCSRRSQLLEKEDRKSPRLIRISKHHDLMLTLGQALSPTDQAMRGTQWTFADLRGLLGIKWTDIFVFHLFQHGEVAG